MTSASSFPTRFPGGGPTLSTTSMMPSLHRRTQLRERRTSELRRPPFARARVNRGKRKNRGCNTPRPECTVSRSVGCPLDALPGERGVGEDGIANHRRLAGVPDPVGVRVRLVGVGRLRAVIRATQPPGSSPGAYPRPLSRRRRRRGSRALAGSWRLAPGRRSRW